MIEKDPDATQTLQTTSDKKYLWVGTTIAEERSGDDGGTVQKRFFSQGFVDSDGTILLYTRDHLGSIRELVDMQQNVRARYEYDPYGNVTKISGDRDSIFLYAGMMWHAPSGLALTFYRAYDPVTGRWISRDPMAENGGVNLYAYVGNNPISRIDPLGLYWSDPIGGFDWLDNAFTNALVNFGDGITFGLTEFARDQNIYGMDFAKVNKCGFVNKAARFLGNMVSMAIGSHYLMAGLGAAGVLGEGAGAAADGFGGLSEAGNYGLQSYGELSSALRGTGLQAHHLIEQRFAAVMGESARDMLSVAVTRAEHQVFTNAWRAMIPYGAAGTGAATADTVMSAAAQIYANYPAILVALGL